MPDTTPKPFDGDSQFTRGMNSVLDPMSLTASGFISSSMNMLNRGGVLQCRPGYTFRFNLPVGRIQGGYFFQPINDTPRLVVAVDGLVYASEYPYEETFQLTNLAFREDAEFLYFCQAEKGSERRPDLTTRIISPYMVLIIQDGFTRPGVWDGLTNIHSANIPVGTAMAASGKRLWIARLRQIFASDIYDPISFIEDDYLSNASSFLTERDVVALAEVTSKADVQLLAFTDCSTISLQSGILDRAKWNETEKFQTTIFPTIGCVAPQSIVTLNGLLWWWSQFGLTNFDAALNTYLSSEFKRLDNEMAISKAGIRNGNDVKVASAAFDNFLLVSVPSSDQFNSHTWVFDSAVAESLNDGTPPAWASFWTGTRPVTWAYGSVAGVNRIFHFSRDYDGNNRCWEAFSPVRLDSGSPIVWAFETRAYNGGNLSPKEFRFAQLRAAEISGTVDVAVFWAGVSNGAYKRCMTKRIIAERGCIRPGRTYNMDTPMFSLKNQSRTLLTADVRNSVKEDKTSCDIESSDTERKDSGFQLFVVGSGQCAIKSIRMFASPEVELTAGGCEPDEDANTNFVRYDGFGKDSLEELEEVPVELYEAEASGELVVEDVTYSGEGFGESVVSEQDALKIAQAQMQSQLALWFRWAAPKLVGGSSL